MLACVFACEPSSLHICVQVFARGSCGLYIMSDHHSTPLHVTETSRCGDGTIKWEGWCDHWSDDHFPDVDMFHRSFFALPAASLTYTVTQWNEPCDPSYPLLRIERRA